MIFLWETHAGSAGLEPGTHAWLARPSGAVYKAPCPLLIVTDRGLKIGIVIQSYRHPELQTTQFNLPQITVADSSVRDRWTRNIGPVPVRCRASGRAAGPASSRHWTVTTRHLPDTSPLHSACLRIKGIIHYLCPLACASKGPSVIALCA